MDILEDWLAQGYHVSVGPHCEKLRGYYACIYSPTTARCEYCAHPFIPWERCGHGETAAEAVDDAIRLALGLHPMNPVNVEVYRV